MVQLDHCLLVITGYKLVGAILGVGPYPFLFIMEERLSPPVCEQGSNMTALSAPQPKCMYLCVMVVWVYYYGVEKFNHAAV